MRRYEFEKEEQPNCQALELVKPNACLDGGSSQHTAVCKADRADATAEAASVRARADVRSTEA